MEFNKIQNILALIPYTSPSKGKIFYDHILKYKPKKCLELGFAKGTSVCYMAAALDELGHGKITAVDIEKSYFMEPNIENLIDKTGLGKYINVVREVNSYNWFLNREIERNSDNNYNCEPIYDFIFIDGPKDWTTDGFAFFLANKLLKKDGWIVFDDYEWNSYKEEGFRFERGIDASKFSDDQNSIPNVKEVFQKLVMQHPDYSNFNIMDDTLAWAQKTRSDNTRYLSFKSGASFKYKFIHLMKKLLRRNY